MNVREFAVLEGLNIAGGARVRDDDDWHLRYRATAAQVAEVLATDERLIGDGLPQLSTREVVTALTAMHKGLPHRRAPLVTKATSRAWSMTREGVSALSA